MERLTIMIRLSLKTLSLGMAALACLPFGSIANAQATYGWVTVGDPGNAADTTTYGAVATSFQIMKYEFTNQQYADFLNSVAATDTYSLYNPGGMGSDPHGGITRSGDSGAYNYVVKPNMGDKPVNYISWFDAARVANWCQNGATSSSSTETGAYTLLNGQTTGDAPAVNNGARFYIPTEDQWYKAAYYKGGGTDAGYWNYATQSDTAPTPVTAGATGIGSAGNTGNFANYNSEAAWNSLHTNVTTVGTNGRPSAYGAFDMSGNLMEWNDLTGAAGSNRGFRGGFFGYNDPFVLSSSSSNSYPPLLDGDAYGFRLASSGASTSAVPEIDPSSLGSVLALVVGSLGLLERRRLKVRLAA